MTVWIVESGEYDQRGINFIAASLDDAVAILKQRHPTDKWIGPRQEIKQLPHVWTLRSENSEYEITEYLIAMRESNKGAA